MRTAVTRLSIQNGGQRKEILTSVAVIKASFYRLPPDFPNVLVRAESDSLRLTVVCPIGGACDNAD